MAISRSANYLMKNTKADGMFEYRINLNPAINVKEKYNILRHAGAMYAMSMYYQLQPDDNMRSAMKRAGKYLRDEAIDTLPGKENMLAVLSKPHDSQGDEPLQAKLGGTGLGLVALLSLEISAPAPHHLPTSANSTIPCLHAKRRREFFLQIHSFRGWC